jgi:ferric iron reductase protein FhuF
MDLVPNTRATIANKFTSVPKNSSTTEVLLWDNTECRWALDLFKTRATKDSVSAAVHLSCKERTSFRYG